ncbi:hypothetical protein [Sphingomonas sp.]|uniref:hypothetical protein n=1 Tax=Sphingomonas sp. TaxID=28214 RepID=UPI00307FC8D0
MVAVVAVLLFTAGAVLSVWTIWTTVAPRVDYMRALLTGEAAAIPAPVSAYAARTRIMPRPAQRRAVPPLRAAA